VTPGAYRRNGATPGCFSRQGGPAEPALPDPEVAGPSVFIISVGSGSNLERCRSVVTHTTTRVWARIAEEIGEGFRGLVRRPVCANREIQLPGELVVEPHDVTVADNHHRRLGVVPHRLAVGREYIQPSRRVRRLRPGPLLRRKGPPTEPHAGADLDERVGRHPRLKDREPVPRPCPEFIAGDSIGHLLRGDPHAAWSPVVVGRVVEEFPVVRVAYGPEE
jgi:hypothetical protein